tara:strand:- start:30 stop:248 length:219 start_codon:yes stop_codon:yes gene_type:complete
MDFQKILRIIQSFEDGALTKDEACELLEGIIFILDKIRPQLKKWILRIVLDGVKVSLSELKEHLQHEAEKEK